MKKIIVTFMIVVLLVISSACGGTGEPQAQPLPLKPPCGKKNLPPCPSKSPTVYSPTPTPTPTTPSPVVTASPPSACGSTLTRTSGVPWRSGTCEQPGYANHVLPATVRYNLAETNKIRTLPRVSINTEQYTEPIYYTEYGSLKTVKCLQYGCQGGSEAPFTGSERVASGSDAQVNIIDLGRRVIYSLWNAERDSDGTLAVNNGVITAGSMAVMSLDGRGNNTVNGSRSTITGSGLSRLFGVVRAHEVQAAKNNPETAIPHALQLGIPPAMNCNTYREPAVKSDGWSSADCIQEGARIVVDKSFDCNTAGSNFSKAVCYALQKYGGYDMDNAGRDSVVVYGQNQLSWSTGVSDYAAAGVNWDFQTLGFTPSKLSVVASWNGQ